MATAAALGVELMAQESVTIRAAVWRGALAGAAAEFRRTDLAAGAFRLAREWLLCLAALFLIDLVFGPPPWVRWLLLAVQVGLLGWRGLPLFLLWRRPPNSDAWAARRLEQLRPDLDNALIHAVQFEAVLPGAVGLASRLMQREVARAEQRPVELPLSDPEERARS
ncbi:MAG: DUF4175 domain-containing protein, partial [Armatimonadetes bacterium]|nr:DUF4175 domain-containing protein [Armatimonadota bacterium]